MSDEKGDDITEPVDEVTTTEQPEVQEPAASAQPDVEENQLSGLMAEGETSTTEPEAKSVDLEAEALKAAENALADGEKALSEAREQIAEQPVRQVDVAPAPNNKRELALRVLLAVNVLAMVVVTMMPSPPTEPKTSAVSPVVVEPQAPVEVVATKMNEPWNLAMRASENRDFAKAVTILEQYLDDNSRMPEGERLSVLSALSFYATRNNDFKKSREYAQKAQALEQSHSLPEDLVKTAQAALDSGDQESLRRIWARFLLQQRQVPSWLYQHVAQAYLELGDSYRQDANTAAEAARIQELAEATARLRAEALKQGDSK